MNKFITSLISASLLLACGGPASSALPITVTEDITSVTTWPTTPSDCDVLVKKEIQVKAALTISAGVKVCFDVETGLIVNKIGSLSAIGTTAERIVFTSANKTPGAWKGLAFVSNDVANKLQFVDVEYAGGDIAFCCGFDFGGTPARAAVLVGEGSTTARLSIQNTKIFNSGNDGLLIFENSKIDAFSTNQFVGHKNFPVSLMLGSAGVLDSASTYGAGTGKNGIRVLAENKTETPVTLKKTDVPYAMSEGKPDETFKIGTALTIEAGAQLRFEATSGIIVEANGSLSTKGTATDKVTFTGRSATNGFWKGIALLSASGNTFTSTDILYAGSNDPLCCGFFEPLAGAPNTKAALIVGDFSVAGAATISNVNIINSANRGVSVLKGTLTQNGTNDLSTGNGSANLLP